MSEEMTEFLKDVAMVLPNTPLAERAIALKTKLTTTPEPAGETVRVRAAVWFSRRKPGCWYVTGSQDGYAYHGTDGNPPDAIIEADIPLPRIPTVAARVVEEKS
jgi:hypothetical protein